jgi:Uncharacterised nucleotidyltransferase
MHRELAKAILATFRDTPQRPDGFARYSQKDWERNYDWLDTSGMALYVLDRLKKLGREGEVPVNSLLRLEEKQKDNRARTEQLFREFCEINASFQREGIRFVNLKGITLVPTYCSDPELRFQVDLDFLLDILDADRCQNILETFGYRLTGASERTWEFKAGGYMVPTLRDMYKPKPQRSVEIHFAESDPEAKPIDDRLARTQSQTWSGITFPALSESDKFVGQSVHLYKHLRSEWIRLSWILEYWNFLHARRDDVLLWNEVKGRVRDDLIAQIAIGMSLRIAATAFGECYLPALTDWAVEVLPKNFERWLECYGEDVVLMEFPGSKLYLLLDAAKEQKQFVVHDPIKKLFPLHFPPGVVYCSSDASFRERWNGRKEEMKYFLFRLRFHVVSGICHTLETARWKYVVCSDWVRRDLQSK